MANIAKRSHEDSSDSEKDIKKKRHEESSEEVEEEEEEEHDEEDEVEINAVVKAENVTETGKWTVEDSHRLLISIMSLLPQCDVELYSEQEAQIDWGKVAFGLFSADQCREHWHKLTKKVRLYRTMSDLVVDALSLLPRPSSSFRMIQKKNRMMNLKQTPIKMKSSFPKMRANAFSLFMQEKLKTLPHIPGVERFKHVSQLYKHLSEAEKNELNERFDETKRNHIKLLKKMKGDDPLLAEEIDAYIKKLEKIPEKRKKPKSSVKKQNNSLLSNASSGRSPRKSSPVKSASIPSKSKAIDNESDQSSDDFGKKFSSKPQSAKAAEEENSSTSDTSDNKEERNDRSPKKSAPVKKFKAIVEKPSVSDHSSSEDETSVSLTSLKPAKKLDNGLKEEKRTMPPKKGHSAVPAVVPETKLSKPSKSKKKKKKKEDVVTGFSQFLTTKMAGYREKYPELNDREIAMKLAGNWERLSDKKKNKYEKLALKKMQSEEVD